MTDKIFKFINNEQQRQNENIELIASENFVSDAVRDAVGSCLTNKYCEGYPEQASIDRYIKEVNPNYVHTGNVGRYYGGCQEVDMVELYCRDMWKQAFHTDYHVNVQPHSGSQANAAVYFGLLNPGDTILSMDLNNGGHLSHGSKANFSGKLYNPIFYGLGSDGYIDMTDFRNKLYQYKPKLVVVGASAYPREIEFFQFYLILDEFLNEFGWRPFFMVDMAHIAGLILTHEHNSPFGIADVITTTTHKTLRGPRGALIFCRPELAKRIDSAVFPCTQGGPLMHVIAGKAVAAVEDMQPEFKEYAKNVKANCKAMADEFIKNGIKLVTNGTDNHLLILDLTGYDITGSELQEELDKIHITANKNCIPNDTRSPKETSGLRIGTAAETTRGKTEKDFIAIADTISNIIKNYKV